MKPTVAFSLAVLLLTGCATYPMDVTWPEPRPLGRDFRAYKPSEQPYEGNSGFPEVEGPTGILTLNQALSLALMRNPELKAFSWEVRAGEARTLQASLLPNPEIGIEGENLGGSGTYQGFEETETTLSLSQLFELGGKRSKRTRVAALNRDLAGWDYETRRLDVLTEATKTFVEVLAAQERMDLTEELTQLAERVLNTVSERVKAGKVSPVEETRAKVALATSQIERERAKRILEGARKRLAATWGSTIPLFARVEGELERIAPIPSLEQLFALISQNPDISRWVVEMEKRRAAVELADSKRIPDLTLGGGLRRLNETDDNAFVLEFSLPLPIFDRNQGGSLEARYRLIKAEEEKRASEVRVYALLADAYQAMAATFSEAKTLRDEVLPGALSAFEAAREGYRQGKFGFLEVLDAQRTLFDARGQYIEVLATYHKAVADVERLIGESIASAQKTSPRNGQ